MKQLVLLALPFAAACGRAGFDQLAAVDAAPDAPPPALACDGSRFPTGTTTTAIGVTPTADGYFVLAVDKGGAVTGTTFEFSATSGMPTGSTLAQGTGPVSITINATGPVAGVGLPAGVLVEVPVGRPDTTGTALIPLDHNLALRGAPATYDGWIAGAGMLARTSSGAITLLGQDKISKNINAQPVDASGGFVGSAVTVVPGSTNPQTATLIAAGNSFLTTWVSPGKDDAEARAQIFTSDLVPTSDAIKISSDPVNGAEFPRAAYAPAADRYLFAWFQKVNGGTDQVWISLRDGKLDEITPPQLVATQGTMPIIAAGTDSFLVVWQSGAPTLSAARVSKDGVLTPLGVSSTGGNAAAWDVVVRDGQPALVWVESGGTGPNLWLNPLCN